mgnify:CR=1 FL=1
MNPIDIIRRPAAYASGYENLPQEAQLKAKQLCWEYNKTGPMEADKRQNILKQLFGTYSPMVGIEPDFHCDYGFNIHFHGFAVLNYNCVILTPLLSTLVQALLLRQAYALPAQVTQ